MMKIGAGAQLKTGRHNAIVATDTGVVKFRVYDKKYVDNSGSYKVSIIRIPAALIPPAQNVE